MNIRKQLLTTGLIALTISLLLNSCKTSLSITDLQTNAEQAYYEGKYNDALQQYENLIKNWNENQAFEQNPFYDKAGHAAFALQDYDKAIVYFNHSMHYGFAGADTYLTLISHYREIENFSREVTVLNTLIEKFPDEAVEASAHERLFEMYVETGRWEEAAVQIPYIGLEPDIKLLEEMLLVHNKLGNEKEQEAITGQLLKLDSNNAAALEWKAIDYFEAGEARYNAETEAYERNKSRSQYARLLKGYEAAGEDYRKARDIFERLYKENPDKRYAMYLYNIYARFQDEEKAAYYRKRF
jgi:tetratricopeptide (TPR) repeat protein